MARPSLNVTWGEISVVQAELLCVGYLLAVPAWKYYVNLVARDMPLRTNAELVQILAAYDGANDVDGTRKVSVSDFISSASDRKRKLENCPPSRWDRPH